MMTAKENVIRTLRHDNPEWIPVNLWQLPAAKLKYGQALDDICLLYTSDAADE